MSAIRDIEREARKREREEVIANLLEAAEGIGAFEVLNAVIERAGYSDDEGEK